MENVGHLASKVKQTLKDEGVVSLAAKTRRYIIFNSSKMNRKPKYKDVLFINGCTLPHPERYRVDHQMEQFESNGLSVDKVFYGNLKLEKLKYYRAFVFFPLPNYSRSKGVYRAS